MKEENKKLFGAPWTMHEFCSGTITVHTQKDFVCRCSSNNKGRKYAKLLQYIPELYDSLDEAILLINRLIGAWEDGKDFADFCDEYLKEYNNVPSGFTCEWIKLLLKVKEEL